MSSRKRKEQEEEVAPSFRDIEAITAGMEHLWLAGEMLMWLVLLLSHHTPTINCTLTHTSSFTHGCSTRAVTPNRVLRCP